MLLFLISLRATREKFKVSNAFVALIDFGFNNEGYYSITMHSAPTDLLFGLLSSQEKDLYATESVNNPEGFCNGTETLAGIVGNYTGSEQTIAGSIPSSGVYYLFFFYCDPIENFSTYDLVISYTFGNGGSWLDTRAMPGLIEQPIAIAAFAVVLLFWIINWTMNKKMKIYIHYMLTTTFILGVASRIVRYGVLKYEEKYDFHVGMQAFMATFRLLFRICIYLVILLCAKGWCVIQRSIKILDLAFAVTWTVLLLVMQTILEYASIGNWRILIVILACVFLFLYTWQLIKSINRAGLVIYARLLDYASGGIDPETTPVWQKRKMMDRLQWLIIIYLLLVLVGWAVLLFVSNFLWLNPMMEDIAELVLCIGLCIVYRLRHGNADGYALLDEMECEMVVLSELDGEIPRGRALPKGGRQWETGMDVGYANTASLEEKVVTLETPDGETQITVKPLQVNSSEQRQDQVVEEV